ncbi:hypothetical protein B0I37DRAFT_425064 [Chaetomium sp. MPI-CAGE-AT-0009]|nr:hypothetical protein B0I37DRAFT_425064 [Chaetomium sp. MPI-CAGE-AT-0009]
MAGRSHPVVGEASRPATPLGAPEAAPTPANDATPATTTPEATGPQRPHYSTTTSFATTHPPSATSQPPPLPPPEQPSPPSRTPPLPATCHHHLPIDLTPRARLPAAAVECEASLDALEALVRAMAQGPGAGGGAKLDVGVLWRLGGLREALGLVPGWVAWLRGCMSRFVCGLGGVGVVAGWMDGWEPEGGGDGDGGGGAAAAGSGVDGDVLEMALGVCAVFGWAEELSVVVRRAAYVWGVGEDGETGDAVLVKPDGSRVDVAVCGRAAVDAIVAAREQALEHVFAAAQQSLYRWTVGIGSRPCRNITCNTYRIAALNTFLLWSGLYPRTKLNKSLQEIISALQYITATDAELAVVAIEHRHGDDHVCDRLLWAAQIRRAYSGTCTECDEKTATSMLFPLEDLLCDVTSELQDHLAKDAHGRT